MKPLAYELIAALAEFDSRLPNLGLYSCFEHQTPAGKTHPYWKIEWDLALRPRLDALGCKLIEQPLFGKPRYCTTLPNSTPVRFLNSQGKVCELRLVRTSMVKVRRYGSGYPLDRHVDFAERWVQLKMEKHIRALWWPDRYQMTADVRMILFLGFDKANRPFHKEITQLEKSTHWPEHQVTHKSKSWPDTYGRDFNIRTACWASREEKI